MEVRPPHKQTEAGFIPADWDCERIHDAAASSSNAIVGGPFGSDLVSADYVAEGVPVIRGQNMSGSSVSGDFVFVAPQKAKSLSANLARSGDLVFTQRGTLGQVAIVPSDRFESYLVSQSQMKVSLNRRRHDPAFVLHYFASRAGQQQIALSAIQTGVPHTNLGILRAYLFPAPPLPEQRAIAAALSDVDALLDGLDRLIAKKRDLKQATMQQLLTGQTRLPGFSGEWEESSFANVVRHHAGNSTLIKGKLHTSEAAGLFPAYSASGQDVWCAHFEHEGNAVVVSAVGSRCGKAFAASGRWSAIANTHVVWPLTSKIDTDFLGFFINDEDFWLKSGTGQPFVLFTQTFARPLLLPSLNEQSAIARVLCDMDAELAALEARRDKTRNLKQGMMQELLTGRTRLV